MWNRKLGRKADHRKALLRNMATSLIENGQIETTEMKAKELSAVMDSLVTLAKRGDLHARRQAAAYVRNVEVDEEGTPYWICPVKKYNIGLFGGVTIGRVVLCNAITGETQDYAIEDAPQWIDRAYSADLLVELYDYHGTLQHGFLNSVFGQKDCLVTTDGYNYLAIDDDVWVYTGVTSITGDFPPWGRRHETPSSLTRNSGFSK